MRTLCVVIILLIVTECGVHAGELLIDQELAVGDLSQEPLKYDVLLPEDYDDAKERLPLLLYLHGGGEGGHVFLRTSRPWIEELWKADDLPPMVIATPHVGALSFYLDFEDGSKNWESIIVGPFLEKLRAEYKVSNDPRQTFLAGISMGGAGTLQIALKRPDQFRAIAAFEPATQPALKWKDVDHEMFFWFTDELWRERYGDPVSESHWEANNPASIAMANAEQIRNSGLKIFLECGDQDYLDCHKGTEFLHRIMWDTGIQHEYRSYHGSDHIGQSIEPRVQEGLRFLGQVLRGPTPDAEVQKWRKDMDYWRRHGHAPPKEKGT